MSLTVEHDGPVAVLTLESTDGLNALHDQLTADLARHLDHLASSGEVRALILTGRGRAFTSGGDLGMLQEMSRRATDSDHAASIRDQMRANARVIEAIRTAPFPSIAAINGACVGAGLGWAAACDLRVASEKAHFDTAFLKLGLSTDFGTSWLLKEALGHGIASDWLMRPRKIPAAEARSVGFVSDVVSSEELFPAAAQWAHRLAATPVAVRAIRQNLQEASTAALPDHLDREAERFVSALASSEASELIEQAAAAWARPAPATTGEGRSA